MPTVGRLKDGNLIIAGGLNERLPPVTNGLVAHFPFDGTTTKSIPKSIRYIRDYLGYGSNANGGNHWIELKAMDFNGNNVALNKYAYNSEGTPIPQFVDGSIDGGQWSIGGMSSGTYHTVDLGGLYDIQEIIVWHYWPDNRRYYNTKTAVSEDGINWHVVFDSRIEGEYVETSTGLRIDLTNPGATCKPLVISNVTLTDGGIAIEEATANLVPGGSKNSYPSYGNGWATYNTNQYNGGQFFSIGTISSVTNNIVTYVPSRTLRTYDVLRPQTSGGGLTANKDYFIKALSSTQFTIHEYNNSEDGSLGLAVHDSIKNDIRVPINATNFPTMWWGAPHLPNSGLVKEVIPNGFKGLHDCLRLHTEFRTDDVADGLAYGVFPPVTQGTTYTISFYHRAVNASAIGKAVMFQKYTNGAYWTNTSFRLGAEWQRHTETLVSPQTGGTNFYLFPGPGIAFDIAEIQVEQKPFATSFVSDNRGHGYLELPIGDSTNIDRAVGSLVMTLSPTSSIYSTTSYIDMVDARTTANATNRFVILRKSANSDGINEMYLRNGSTWVALGIAQYVRKDAENTFVWTWENGAQYAMYVNGARVATGSYTTANTNLDKIIFQHNMVNLKDVSVYNRALSDAEIMKLSKNTFSIDSKGTLMADRLIEGPNNIPTSATHFPLSTDTFDKYRLIRPIAESNVAYEDGAAWIGSAVTNVYAGTAPWSNNGGAYYDVTGTAEAGPIENSKTWKLVKTATGNQWNGWQGTYGGIFSGVTGDYWTISGWYKTTNSAGKSTISCGGFYLSDWSRAYNATWIAGEGTTIIPDGKWHYFYGVMRLNENMTNAILVAGPCWDYSTQAGELYVNGIQWVKTKVPSPYVYGTRGNTTIKFDDMKLRPQLPSKKPFTYIMWFKIHPQVATADAPLMSCTEGGGFALALIASGAIQGWVHNSTGYPTLVSNGYDYRDNKWHMAALIAGTDDTVIYVDGKEVARSKGAMTGKDVYYGSANYNLFIGTENDNGTPSASGLINGYVKDFLAIPAELSASEIRDMYNTQMRTYSGSTLKVQGELKEGGKF